MIDQAKLQTIITRLVRSSSVVERPAMSPAREWFTGILITICFVCVGGVVSYWLYLNTVSVEAEVQDSITATSYKGALVEEAVMRFRARGAAYEQIRARQNDLQPVEAMAPVPPVTTESPITEVPADLTPEPQIPTVEPAEEATEESAPTLSF
ncbi:MAG: hypothetical protein RLZZ360_169 [Candidatus Parcubacteria bacterium]|jgi:hypothetical protein